MVLIVVEDGSLIHTGSICSGSAGGTVSVGSNSFVFVEGKLIMVEDGTLNVNLHTPPDCVSSPFGHTYTVNLFQQNFVTIEGLKIVLLNDAYTTDSTIINNQGSNSFVEVTV